MVARMGRACTSLAVADLEEHALRRDRRFLVRLGLSLGVGLIVGLFLFAKLTSEDTGTCASTMFGSVAPPENTP